jgi:hypothetical protein
LLNVILRITLGHRALPEENSTAFQEEVVEKGQSPGLDQGSSHAAAHPLLNSTQYREVFCKVRSHVLPSFVSYKMSVINTINILDRIEQNKLIKYPVSQVDKRPISKHPVENKTLNAIGFLKITLACANIQQTLIVMLTPMEK